MNHFLLGTLDSESSPAAVKYLGGDIRNFNSKYRVEYEDTDEGLDEYEFDVDVVDVARLYIETYEKFKGDSDYTYRMISENGSSYSCVKGISTIKKGNNGCEDGDWDQDEVEYVRARAIVAVYEEYTGLTAGASDTSIITNLARYFKSKAWVIAEGGWKANKSSIQNALMYAILVAQSLIFFISYTKRLFYVIMLIIMAPIVVVFDFFMKFGK